MSRSRCSLTAISKWPPADHIIQRIFYLFTAYPLSCASFTLSDLCKPSPLEKTSAGSPHLVVLYLTACRPVPFPELSRCVALCSLGAPRVLQTERLLDYFPSSILDLIFLSHVICQAASWRHVWNLAVLQWSRLHDYPCLCLPINPSGNTLTLPLLHIVSKHKLCYRESNAGGCYLDKLRRKCRTQMDWTKSPTSPAFFFQQQLTRCF